jgi:hypothetical protein
MNTDLENAGMESKRAGSRRTEFTGVICAAFPVHCQPILTSDRIGILSRVNMRGSICGLSGGKTTDYGTTDQWGKAGCWGLQEEHGLKQKAGLSKQRLKLETPKAESAIPRAKAERNSTTDDSDKHGSEDVSAKGHVNRVYAVGVSQCR